MRNFKEIKDDYYKQDNRGTAFPFYVSVQEKHCVGVMADGYGVNCPYGDGEEEIEWKHEDLEGTYESKEKVMECLEEEGHPTEALQEHKFEEINVGYIWVEVQFFLTIQGAEQYMKANAHNHGKLRTYVKWIENRNFEMRTVMEHLELKNKEQ